MKHAINKKKHKRYNSDSDDSDSSWDDGLSSTRNVCSRHERNKHHLSITLVRLKLHHVQT